MGGRLRLLCKFICKAPVSGTKQLDNHHFVGNATGIMPVWQAKRISPPLFGALDGKCT